ncbi:hypothetical protein L1856_26370 [Streptomyces sp. Tue 6430]|nr:hypothetical protein [Streptomyces sp. Tue 6430]
MATMTASPPLSADQTTSEPMMGAVGHSLPLLMRAGDDIEGSVRVLRSLGCIRASYGHVNGRPVRACCCVTSFGESFFLVVSILLTSIWQPDRMVSDMDERWLELVTGLSKAALDLASSAVTISQPVDGPVFGLRFIQDIAYQQQELERLLIAVLHHSGVPWEVLAHRYGVTRQSLHRRLAAPVKKTLTTGRNQRLELRKAEEATEHLADVAEIVFANLGRLGEAAAIWRQRQAEPQWWTNSSHYSFE